MTSLRIACGAAALASLLLSGCAMVAPAYSPSLDNVDRLKAAGSPARPGRFEATPGAPGMQSISLRGNAMAAPQGDYAAYLADALRLELQLAGRLDPAAPVQIGGVLVKNVVEAGGLATNSGEIEARFTVVRDGTVRYERTHRVQQSWESSFAGAIAIPRAQQQYPLLVQQLLRQLFSDNAFFDALR